jgi:hypothetical protein
MRGIRTLWLLWAAMFATLLVWLALPAIGPQRAQPWYEAQTAVARFTLAILGLVATVGTFAVRESLVLRDVREGRLDPASPEGMARLRVRFLGLWTLCAVVGALGGLLAYYSGQPARGWPYLAGAAALFVLHAPQARFLRRVREGEPKS